MGTRVRLRKSVQDFMARRKQELRQEKGITAAADTAECDNVYNQFGGKPVGVAAAEGFFSGLAGMIGASAFFNPVDSSVISNLTDGFDDLKSKWQTTLDSYQNKLTQTQMDFHQRQLDLLQSIDTFHSEILNEKIQTNTLLITVVFFAMVIVIAYLAFL